MKVTLESTGKIVYLNEIPARIWEGKTESGIPLHAFITRVAVDRAADTTQFEKELEEMKPPSPEVNRAYPLRMIL